MEDSELKMITAQLVVNLRRLEKLEYEVKGGGRLATVQIYVDELRREAEKIVNQIR